jgi:hypothetical protein
MTLSASAKLSDPQTPERPEPKPVASVSCELASEAFAAECAAWGFALECFKLERSKREPI